MDGREERHGRGREGKREGRLGVITEKQNNLLVFFYPLDMDTSAVVGVVIAELASLQSCRAVQARFKCLLPLIANPAVPFKI